MEKRRLLNQQDSGFLFSISNSNSICGKKQLSLKQRELLVVGLMCQEQLATYKLIQ